MNEEVHQYVQATALLVKAVVLFAFGASIIAYQWSKRNSILRWPMSGAYVGALFLIIDSLQPFHMAALRLNLLSWPVYSLPTTGLYVFIAINSAAAFNRWWRKGFDDAPGPWDGGPHHPAYTGRNRRLGPKDRRRS